MRKVFSKIKIPDKSTVGIGAAERCFLDRWSNLASFVSNINRNRKEGGKGRERKLESINRKNVVPRSP